MKKDYSLDDLIIDDIKPTKNKNRGVLALLAVFIALLVIAIVMTRLYLGDSDQNTTKIGEKHEELISPELKLDSSDHDLLADKKELDQLSSMMEETLVNKTDPSLEDPKDPESSQVEPIKPEVILIDETDAQGIEKPVQQESVQKEPAEKTQPQVKKSIEIPTPTVKKPVAKVKPKKTQPKKAKSSYSYYIQVGSFTTQPSKQFLSVISKNGFHYKLKKGKLLIGPYSSDATARRDLARVKSKINKKAFIKHF